MIFTVSRIETHCICLVGQKIKSCAFADGYFLAWIVFSGDFTATFGNPYTLISCFLIFWAYWIVVPLLTVLAIFFSFCVLTLPFLSAKTTLHFTVFPSSITAADVSCFVPPARGYKKRHQHDQKHCLTFLFKLLHKTTPNIILCLRPG